MKREFNACQTHRSMSVSVTACRQRSYYSTAFLGDQSLVPCCFCSYTADVFDIIASFRLTRHSYADDTQVYISAPVEETQRISALLAECIEHLDRWMGQNRLKLNADKTQLLWLGTRQQLPKLTITRLPLATTVSSFTVEIDSTVTDLGVTLDGQLSLAAHVSSICRSEVFPATSAAVNSSVFDD